MKKRSRLYAYNTGILVKIAIYIFAVIAALVFIYCGGRWLEQRAEEPQVRGDLQEHYAYLSTVTVDGKTYCQRGNLKTVLLMGIDRDASQSASTGRANGGQADFLELLIIDPSAKRIARVRIDRDTMTPIPILGVLGNRSGMRTAQISLSHSFGDGKETSCELTREAVSNLLLGVPIQHYIAINLDGIAKINDLMGGVTVTLEEDFSALDPAMQKGKTLTLTGKQAEIYVRGRMGIGDGTNTSRMDRQSGYIERLLQQVRRRLREDTDSFEELYDTLSPYMTGDMSRNLMINEAVNCSGYSQTEEISLQGEHRIGSDGFMQFYPDEDKLQALVLDLFYQEVA